MSLDWTQSPAVSIAFWMLVHSIWQAAVIALVSHFARRKRTHVTRLAISWFALFLFLVVQGVTLSLLVYNRPADLGVTVANSASDPDRVAAMLTNRLTATGKVIAESVHEREWWRQWVRTAGQFGVPLVSFWLLLSVVLLLKRVVGVLILNRFFARLPAVDASQCGNFDDLRAKMGVQRPVRFVMTGAVDAPATFGWRKPVVLLPRDSLDPANAIPVRAAILHELAHVRRVDYVSKLLLGFSGAIYSVNPLFAALRRHALADHELACDQAAAAVAESMGISRERYAEILVDYAKRRRTPDVANFGGLAGGGALSARVGHLLNDSLWGNRTTSWSSLLGSTLAIGLLVALIGTPVLKAARLDRQITFAEQRSFGDTLLTLFSLERDNPQAVDLIADGIAMVREYGRPGRPSDPNLLVRDPRFARLVKGLSQGVSPAELNAEVARQIGLKDNEDDIPGWRLGTLQEQRSLLLAFVSVLQSANPPFDRQETARAAMSFGVMTGAINDCALSAKLLREPAWTQSIGCSPDQLNLAWISSAVRSYRIREIDALRINIRDGIPWEKQRFHLERVASLTENSLLAQQLLARVLDRLDPLPPTVVQVLGRSAATGRLAVTRRLLQDKLSLQPATAHSD